MGSYLVQVGPSRIHPTHDEVGANVPLVAEELLLVQPIGCHNPDQPARVEPVQLQLAADGSPGIFTVASSPSTGTILNKHRVRDTRDPSGEPRPWSAESCRY